MSLLCLMMLSHYAHPLVYVWCSTATHFIAQNMNHKSHIHSGSLTLPVATNHSPASVRSKHQLKENTLLSTSYAEESESVFSTVQQPGPISWSSSKCHCIHSTSESTSLHLCSRNPQPQQLPAGQGRFRRCHGRTASGQEERALKALQRTGKIQAGSGFHCVFLQSTDLCAF